MGVALVPIINIIQHLINVLQHLINFFCFALLKQETARSSSACLLNFIYKSVPIFVVMIVEDVSECDACDVHVNVFTKRNFNKFVHIAKTVYDPLIFFGQELMLFMYDICHNHTPHIPFLPKWVICLPYRVPPFLALIFCYFSAIEAQKSGATMFGDFAIYIVTHVVVSLTPSNTRL
jgi:hypothetical protein